MLTLAMKFWGSAGGPDLVLGGDRGTTTWAGRDLKDDDVGNDDYDIDGRWSGGGGGGGI